MVGRLSTYAKNRILCLRFQNNHKITQISRILQQEDNIKVSRESVSAFLKKYNETKSIEDKPRPGRRKKLTDEEIELIGEITRLNPDITAPKIKEYLKLNVSSYTILRASKLFDWNKVNPNSNEAKRAAALEQREMQGIKKQLRKHSKKRRNAEDSSNENDYEMAVLLNSDTNENHNLNMLTEKDIMHIKNVSSSPMVFASKILLQIFRPDELKGHYVCGKVISKSVKHKKPLLDKRIVYIKWLVDSNFNTSNKDDLWQLCRRAINKTILHNERSGFKNLMVEAQQSVEDIALSPPLTVTDNDDNDIEHEFEGINKNKLENEIANQTRLMQTIEEQNDLKLLNENEIIDLRQSTCSPMIFATKLLLKVFSHNELRGHSVANNWFKNEKRYIRLPLDDNKVKYIKFLVEKHFKVFNKDDVWKACCKAINRAIRKSELKSNCENEKFNDLQQLASFAVSTELTML